MTIPEPNGHNPPPDPTEPEFRSRRGYTWMSCREKTCCTRTVAVTGADIARIASHLAVEPWTFVELTATTPDDPAGFAMDESGDRHATVLRHEGNDCAFLMRTRTGAGRCGLGELAPTACRMFPATVDSSTGAGTECTCRQWTDGVAEGADLGPLRRQAAAEGRSWHDTAQRWNEFAVAAGATAGLTTADLLRYALDVQSTLGEGVDW